MHFMSPVQFRRFLRLFLLLGIAAERFWRVADFGTQNKIDSATSLEPPGDARVR